MYAFENASLNDLLHDEICEHLVQETITNPQHGYSSEVLQQILPPMSKMKSFTKFLVLKLYKENLLDEELSDLLCSESDQCSRVAETKTITLENKEHLEKTIHAAREKIKNLVVIKQINPEIAKIFLPMLLLDKCYLDTLVINRL